MCHARPVRFAATFLLALPAVCRAQGGALTLNDALDNASLVFTTGGNVPWNPLASAAFATGDAAWATVPSGSSAWIETTVSGPGWLSCWTAGTGFSITGAPATLTSNGSIFRRELPAGSHTVRWTVNAGGSSVVDGWLDIVDWYPINPMPLATIIPPAGVVWNTSPAYPWHGAAWPDADGGGALRPPAGVPAGADTWIEAVVAGPSEIEFLTWRPEAPGDGWTRTVAFTSGASMRWYANQFPASISALDGVMVRPEIPLAEALDGAGITWTRQSLPFYGTAADSFDGSDAVRLASSQDIAPRTGTLTGTFAGPAWFRIKAKATGAEWPYIGLSGSETRATWTPEANGWRTCAIPVPPGAAQSVVIEGRYPPGLLLDQASVESLAANSIADGLEAPDFVWTTSATFPWQYSPLGSSVSPDTAGVCMKTNGTAWLETTVTGPGVASFLWRGTDSEGFNLSEFLVDGTRAAVFYHRPYWEEKWDSPEISLPAGTHTLRWQMVKVRSGGNTCTELDAFAFRPGSVMHTAVEADGLVLNAPTSGLSWALETADTADGSDALRFPAAALPPASQLLTTGVAGPGRLRFSWKSPAGGGANDFVFGPSYVYAQVATVRAEPGSWKNEDIPVPGGFFTVGWGGYLPAGGLLDRVSWTPDVPTTFAEALDGAGIVWSTDPANPWLAWASPGTEDDYAVPAPQLRTPPATSSVVLTGTVTGPGDLSFTWRSSSGIDPIFFLANGYSLNTWNDGGTVTFPLAPGVQTLRWIYGGSAAGEASLDHVSFTPLVPVSAGEATETGDRVWRTDPAAPWQGYQLSGATGDDALLAAPVNGSWVETDVTGPGLLDFWIIRPALSGEKWIVAVDGVAVSLPEPSWPGIFVPDPGVHTVRWTYQTTTLLAPPFGLDNVSWTPTASPDLAAALDSALTIATSEFTPWKGSGIWSHDGTDTACSVGIGSGQWSWMDTTVSGPATVTFFWRLAYHKPAFTPSLTLLVDGADLISAPLGQDINQFEWQQVTVSLGAGDHVLRWLHSGANSAPTAGPNLNSGAWVDELTVSDDPGLAGALDFNGSGVVAMGTAGVVTGAAAHDGIDAVALGESGEMRIGLPEPGLLGFWWKANGPSRRLWIQIMGPSGGFSEYFEALDDAWHFVVIPSTFGQGFGQGHTASFMADVFEPGDTVLVDGLTFLPRGPVVPLADALDYSATPWTIRSPVWIGSGSRGFDGVDAAWSAVTPDTGTSNLSTTLDGPGTLTFRAVHEGSSVLRLKIHGDLLPGFDNGPDWSLHTIRLGSGSHSVLFAHEPLANSVFGEAFVDQFTWTPGSDLTLDMAADAPAFTWPLAAQTWWRPVGYPGLHAVGDHAMIVTTGSRPPAETRSEALTIPVTGPAMLRWRWRWTNHPVTAQSAPRGTRSVEKIAESGIVFGGGSARSPTLFCSVDGDRLCGLARWGSTVDTDQWYEDSAYVPEGQHSVAWQMLADHWQAWSLAAGISGLVDAVSLQPVSPAYGTWIAGQFNDSAGQAPTDDPDGDGVPNAIEWAAGTIASDGTSRPEIALTFVDGHPRLAMPIAGQAGVNLHAEQSADLQTWVRAGFRDLSATTPGWFTVDVEPVAASGGSLFLRIAGGLAP